MAVVRLKNGETGQVTAYFVAISVVIFGLMALAIDVGFFFHARRVVQNAADPAALAGAAYLQGCPLAGVGLNPVTVACDYADNNLRGKAFTRADLAHQINVVSFTPLGGSVPFPSVHALVRRQQNYLLAQFLPGLRGSFVTVPAEAQAVCGPIQTGSVCPMYIVGNPNAPVVRDGNGDITSAYGVTVGQVYSMKDSSAHIGGLSAPAGPGTDAWRDFIRDGCVSPGGETLEVIEGGTVETKPGNWGNPTKTAFEGGNGANSDGLFEIELEYEDYYGGTDLFPYGHLNCNLALTVDPADPAEVLTVRRYVNGVPSGPNLTNLEVVDAINDMTDPAEMPAGNPPPCGGVRKDGSVVPEMITPSVQGRFMDIVMTSAYCNNRCDLPVLGIMRMYIVCWTNQEAESGNIPVGNRCVPNGGPNETTIYGVFADFTAPNTLGGGGLGTNPLSPRHVVLVK